MGEGELKSYILVVYYRKAKPQWKCPRLQKHTPSIIQWHANPVKKAKSDLLNNIGESQNKTSKQNS